LDAADAQAYAARSSIEAGGNLRIKALADQSVTTGVGAGSVAVSAGGQPAFGLSGAGAGAENKIANKVQAYIDGDGTGTNAGIEADKIDVTANDKSRVFATVAAASLAVGLSGQIGGALSIGVGIARNYINNDIAAYIANANDGVESRTGSIT